MTAMPQQFEGESITMKTRIYLRALGFLLLSAIVLVIVLIFYYPAILTGFAGILIPMGLFGMLLLSFYLLILSTKS
jgi:uncharacterized membrane protein